MATCSVVNASVPNKSKLEETQSKEITVNFGVFFDGTNNQRLQVAMGKLNRGKNSKKEKEKIKKDIERIGGTFDEEQFKKNGNIKYTLSDPSTNKEKEFEKLNKKIAKYNKKHGNRANASEHDTIESFAWDEASGVKKDEETIEQALDKKDGFRIGMPRSPMQGVDFTNIARLEPSYNEQPSSDYTYKIYVTGSGTFADLDKGIDITGLAAGQNSAGVVQKVKDALDAISKIIDKINSDKNKIESVNYKFNVFGFSRGATEARLFVDLCSKVRDGKRPKLLDDIIRVYNRKFNIEKEKKSILSAISFGKQISIEFPFVGLFDTVSSVGINPGIWNNVVISGGLNVAEKVTPSVSDYHKSNKNDLGLDTLVYDSNVKHIVHICALDEFRENFALQVLPTSSSKVEQFFLPGVHADIGGGDLDGYGDEKHIPTVHRGKTLYIPNTVTPGVSQKKQNLLEINLNNLKRQGWIKDSNDSSLMPDITGEKNGVIKLQKYTERGYTYLPLNIMAEKACEKSCKFDNLKEKYAIPTDVLPQDFSAIQTDRKGDDSYFPKDFSDLQNKWKGDDSIYGHCYFPEDNVYKLLRQKRLHFSSCIKKTAGLAYVNGPNLTESDDKENPVSYYDRFLDYHPHPKGWYGKINEKDLKLDNIVFEQEGNQNDDDYLGEAVVVFNRKNRNEEYDSNFYCTAIVTVYGIDGTRLEARGATTPGPGQTDNPNTIKDGFYYAFHQDMATSIYGTRGPRLHNLAYQAINQAIPLALEKFRQSNEDEVRGTLVKMSQLEIKEQDVINLIKNNKTKKSPTNDREKCIHELANMANNWINVTIDQIVSDAEERNDIKQKIINQTPIMPGVRARKTYQIAQNKNHTNLTLPATPADATGIFLHRTNGGGGARFSSRGCLIIDERYWDRVEEKLGTSQDVFIFVKQNLNSTSQANQPSRT